MTKNGEHAVVLGASMAGLLAARVLTETYARVTIVERDELPRDWASRRGVPQGRHAHGIHPRGAEILEELFPGVTERMVADGGVSTDMVGNVRWMISGHRFRQQRAGLTGLFTSRPFLEAHIRDRVRALPTVTILDGHTVAGLHVEESVVTGVHIDGPGGASETVAAQIVVDATGRGSRTPRWLDELGYDRPAEDAVEIGLGYATRRYRLRPGALGDDTMVLIGGTPANSRAGVMAATEDEHIVTLGGIRGDHPPIDVDGFRAFAASLSFPDIADALVGAEPLDEGVTFRFPASVRRRYEHLTRFPAGLLVIGDAVCSFNPIYGQGMTVSGLQALTLRRALARGPVPEPTVYFRRLARAIDTPWEVAVGADLVYPDVPGRRTAKVRLINTYLERLHAAATHDASLGHAFIRVIGLLDPPPGLLRPDRALRVWWTNRRRAAAVAPHEVTTPLTAADVVVPRQSGAPAIETDVVRAG